jgi:NitT/TauT family transport system permease protein
LTLAPVADREPTAWHHARLLAAARGATQRLIGPLIALLIWHLASTVGWVDARFVPAPLTVLRTLLEWMFGTTAGMPYSGTWFLHAASSAYRVFAGFLIAAVLGVVLGSLIGWFRLFSDLLDPIIQMLRPIPITAWVPFAVIFFGIRDASAFFLIALGAFFPIVVNTAAGVAGTPKLLVRAARMLGIRRYMLLPRVVLPSAMPFIFTGLRLGIGLAWVLVIVAEMLAVKSGLGFAMWDAYYFLRMDVIIAAMLSVGVLGFLSDLAIRLLGGWVLRWSRGL